MPTSPSPFTAPRGRARIRSSVTAPLCRMTTDHSSQRTLAPEDDCDAGGRRWVVDSAVDVYFCAPLWN